MQNYSILKDHFDKLILGGHRYGNGLEPIRDSYKTMFNLGIGLLDVYQTNFSIKNNPLDGIITLVGPYGKDVDEYPCGIIQCGNNVYVVDHFVDDILRGISDDIAKEYAYHIYGVINRVVSMDAFFKSDSDAYANPFIATIKCIPFYLTYHHVRDTGLLEKVSISLFEDLLEKYIVSSGEDIDSIMNSISSSRYCTDYESIYRIMTDKGTIPLFY